MCAKYRGVFWQHKALICGHVALFSKDPTHLMSKETDRARSTLQDLWLFSRRYRALLPKFDYISALSTLHIINFVTHNQFCKILGSFEQCRAPLREYKGYTSSRRMQGTIDFAICISIFPGNRTRDVRLFCQNVGHLCGNVDLKYRRKRGLTAQESRCCSLLCIPNTQYTPRAC